jgi:subtilase family serine protease
MTRRKLDQEGRESSMKEYPSPSSMLKKGIPAVKQPRNTVSRSHFTRFLDREFSLRDSSPRQFFGVALAVLLLSLGVAAQAQVQGQSQVAPRITEPINESSLVPLTGTVHPLANAGNDLGPAPDDMQLERMHLILKRSPAQDSALRQLVTDLHAPGSASYHKWLTPDTFGQQFGAADQDIATVEAWLQSHGFSVTKVNPGKQTIEVSGNVAQLRSAFHTQIHRYSVNGETHYANSTDPQIPSAVAPVVGGFVSLNNFRARSQVRVLGKATYDPTTDKATPEWTVGRNTFVLSPADFAVQYDLPGASSGLNGTGQAITVVNDSNINVGLVNSFRTLFSLPANPPQVIIDGNDPGIDGINNPDGPNYDSTEAYLDVEWSGAVAPDATVYLVIGADTALESGLILAAEHAVYGNIAPVLSLSFGACERNLGSSNAFLSSLWQQAAAQGITVVVSTGDSGSAGCDNPSQYYAVGGAAVSGYASTPYNVGVGGTDFYYSSWNQGTAAINSQLGTYWNTTPSNSTPAVSIKSVIPEQPWNDSQFGLNIGNYYAATGNTTIGAGSGGASSCATGVLNPATGAYLSCTAGYAKPSWQTGTGVPNDNVRDLPDVSLFAADGVNSSYYPICYADGDCQPASSGGTVQFTGVGGTSASAPSFAGIMALVNQKYGRQGQADFVLYPLKAQFPAAFHDVSNGTNSVPCNIGTTSTGRPPLNCISVSSPITVTDPTYGAATEGQIGSGTTPEYNAAAGYNLATGLGTIDANQLITNWGNVKFASTTTTLSASPTSITHGAAVTISGSVTAGSGTPTGAVALMTDSTEPVQQGQTRFTLSNGAFSSSLNTLPGGTYNVWGQYSGDASNAASTSQKTQVTVNPETSGIYFTLISSTGTVASGTSNIDYGTQLILNAQVAPSSQLTAFENCQSTHTNCPTFTLPTGTVVFSDSSNTINTAVINAEGDAEYNAPFALGSHSVAASYAGDNSYSKSTASAITFTVVKDTPQVFLSASNQTNATNLTQVVGGQATVFNIQVENNAQATAANPSSGIVYPVPVAPPTGTITMTGLPSGVPTTGTLVAAVDPSVQGVEGVATITAPANTPSGTYNVTIKYSGDANYNAASVTTTVQIASSSGLASTTTATAAGSISPTTNITITGSVTGQSGHPAPTGNIFVYSSGYSVATLTLTAPTSGDVSTFSTTLNSQTLFQGANFVTLQYSGDNNYNPSAFTLNNGSAYSNPLSDFSMVPQTTLVPITSGGQGTDTINIVSTNGFSGAVTFTCTSNKVTCSIPSSATLTSGSSTPLTLNISAGSSAANGDYNVLITGTDSTGKYVHTLAIEAVVTGSSGTTAGFSLSSNPATLTLTAGATTGNTSTITATPSGGFTGSVAVTCAVTGPSGATSPATCTLSNNSVPITTTAAVPFTLTVTTTATTTAGNYTVTVTGTAGSTVENTTVTVTVTAPANANFTLSSTAAAAVNPGATTTSTITVHPTNGFTASVALSCQITTSPTGASNIPSCSLSPTSTTTTSTLTITTTAATSGAIHRPLDRFFTVAGGVAVAGLLFFGIPARRRSWRAILGIVVFAAIAGMGIIGCGGGSSSSGGGGNSGTTAGNYVVTVTGTSGSLTPQTTTVSVTVN